MSAVSASGARRVAARRATSARVPRRVSGPVAGRAAARPVPQHGPTVGARALALVRSLPDHSLIDRLVRGRAWIPVLGVLLAGIVFTQVEILKLGTGFGRSLDRTTALQSQNELLQASVASLDNPARIKTLATGMGMVMPSAQLLKFVPSPSQGELGRAIANIQPADPADFAEQLASLIQAADPSAPSVVSTSSSPGVTDSLASAGTTSTSSAQGDASTPGTTTGDAATPPTTAATTGTAGTATGTVTDGTATDGTATDGTATDGTGTDETATDGTAAGGTTTAATGAAGLTATQSSQPGTPAGG